MVEKGGTFIDATMGLGGHSMAILQSSPNTKVWGFEWNEDSYEYLVDKFSPFKDRVEIFNENFARLGEVLSERGVKADGILFDLGVSSFLIEGSGRGFTFQKEEPLDMRMNKSSLLTAKEVLNRYGFLQLKEVFKRGEVPRAESFAKFLCGYRRERPLETTKDLVLAVKSFYKRVSKDLLAVIFQSIRIEVNRELENLRKALEGALKVLKPGARIVVISFHSLEDRIVKEFLKMCPEVRPVTKKPIVPSREEVRRNPRARSAKMRVGEVKGGE